MPWDKIHSKAFFFYLRLLSSLFNVQHQHHTPAFIIINIRDGSSALARGKSLRARRLSSNKHPKVQLFIKIISTSKADWKLFKNNLYGELRPRHADDPGKENEYVNTLNRLLRLFFFFFFLPKIELKCCLRDHRRHFSSNHTESPFSQIYCLRSI